MTFGTVDGGAKLSAMEYPTGRIANQNFDTVECLKSFVRMGGPNAELDVETRTSGNFDLERDLSDGRAEDPAKTDWLPWYRHGAQKRTSYFYNQLSAQLVGDYVNWVFAQPAKDRRLTTPKTTLGTYGIVSEGGREEIARWGLPGNGGMFTHGVDWG